jgi:hypothetical protein
LLDLRIAGLSEAGALPSRWREYARRLPSSLEDLKGPPAGKVELVQNGAACRLRERAARAGRARHGHAAGNASLGRAGR